MSKSDDQMKDSSNVDTDAVDSVTEENNILAAEDDQQIIEGK